ncbi:MAG: DUF4037 domain-containing protein [Treponema sp.]|nr:DUF4037 domain-containing protein [Treponema sp.]
MKYKTKLLVDRFASIVSKWPGVECVSLNESALPDTLHPYFALILDIYYTDSIPGAEERQVLYGPDLEAFETSGNESKDRFLIGDIPVRLEYKSVGMIDELVNIAENNLDSLWFIKDSGTYGFYRLSKGEVIFSRNNWIQGIRDILDNLPDDFWRSMRNAHESKMEHFLSDLGSAVLQKDNFFYLSSSAGFIKSACLTLLCINKHFEPSHRAYYGQVSSLKKLPDSFLSYFENFLRQDNEITMERKFSLAQLITRDIVAL